MVIMVIVAQIPAANMMMNSEANSHLRLTSITCSTALTWSYNRSLMLGTSAGIGSLSCYSLNNRMLSWLWLLIV